MQLIVSKIGALVLLAGLRLLAGLLPLKVAHKLNQWSTSSSKPELNLKRKATIDLTLSVLLCFGAGLLLATCFIHMLPEVRESFQQVASMKGWHTMEELPVGELLVCVGFLIVYFLEEIGEKFMSSAEHESSTKESSPAVQAPPSGKLSTISTTNLLSHSTTSLSLDDSSSNRVSQRPDSIPGSASTKNHGHSHSLNFGNLHQKPLFAALRGLLIIAALSFHAIFEGMAIGLQLNVRDVWFLFGAVTFHELAIVFCVGLELLTSSIRTTVYIVYMVSLALITPLGLGIGILVTEYSTTQSAAHILTVGVLQALAGGTILYVTFFEVLDKERKKPDNRIVKFVCVTVGFAIMVVLEVAGGGHGHGDHSTPATQALVVNSTMSNAGSSQHVHNH